MYESETVGEERCSRSRGACTIEIRSHIDIRDRRISMVKPSVSVLVHKPLRSSSASAPTVDLVHLNPTSAYTVTAGRPRPASPSAANHDLGYGSASALEAEFYFVRRDQLNAWKGQSSSGHLLPTGLSGSKFASQA